MLNLTKNVLFTGYLTINNDPLVGVVVHLDDDPNTMSTSITSPYMAITDSRGHFKLRAFKNNKNYIGLNIPWHLIKDKQLTTPWSSTPI